MTSESSAESSTRGVADLICWGCQRETGGITGEMRERRDDTEFAWGDDTDRFYPDEQFECPVCGTVDDFAWTDFTKAPADV